MAPAPGSAAHQRRSVSTSGVNIRSAPAPSLSRGCALCGSHLAHSQAANAVGAATTASRASAGLCHRTNCATTARANARAAAPSGSSQIVPVSRNDSATGRSDTTECAMRNRRNASAVTGSNPSGGPVSGGIRRVARRCAPRPMRTCPKSASAVLRSHRRAPATTAGHASGSGCAASADARCAAAASCTARRIWPR